MRKFKLIDLNEQHAVSYRDTQRQPMSDERFSEIMLVVKIVVVGAIAVGIMLTFFHGCALITK